MTITVAIKLNGGAAGAPLSCAAGAAITATLDSTAGVNSVAWTIAAADDLSEPGDYTLVQSGLRGETVDFNALATLGTAAILQAVVNADPTLYARAKFFVPAANGMETGADGEGYEGDATHGTARISNEAIRASGTGSYASATRVLTAGAGMTGGGDLTADRTFNVIANADGSITVNANDIQVGILATDAQHGNRGGGGIHSNAVAGSPGTSGFMTGAQALLVNNATATPTASTIAKWGASVDLGAAYFYGAGTVATAGVLRVANNVAGAAARGSGAFNLTTWKWSAADVLELGDGNNGAGLDLIAKGGGAQKIRLNIVGASNYTLIASTTGLGFFGSPSGATAGDGVMTVNAATTDPTGAPTGTAVDVWASVTNGMQARTGKALTVTLTPVTTTTATDQRLDKMHRSVHTSDASVTQIATYTLPAACCWVARFFVTGQQTGTDATAVYSFEVTAVRAAGAATVTTGTVTTLVDTIGVAGVPSAVASTNDVSLRVQGKAGPTEIDWCLSAVHVHLYGV